MLGDLGDPPPDELAAFWGVSLRSVYRWLSLDEAPRPAALALFWLTRWGRSARECEAINRARAAAGLADALQAERAALRRELARVVAQGQFEAANSPTARDLPPAPADGHAPSLAFDAKSFTSVSSALKRAS